MKIVSAFRRIELANQKFAYMLCSIRTEALWLTVVELLVCGAFGSGMCRLPVVIKKS